MKRTAGRSPRHGAAVNLSFTACWKHPLTICARLRWIFWLVLVVSCLLQLLSLLSLSKTRNPMDGNNTNPSKVKKEKPILTWDRYYRSHFWRPSLLIAHYASRDENDKYRGMMKESSKLSRAYCRRWRCDVLQLEGTLLKHPTHNKVGLVEMAFWNGYSRMLLLDADSILVNHTVDVATQLIPYDKMVMAHHVSGKVEEEPWNVNIGVTVWNLRHPLVLLFAWRWRQRCEKDSIDNDQFHYHQLMKSVMYSNAQLATTKDYFQYRHGSIVKHFIRDSDQSWGAPAPERLDSLREQVRLVCQNNTFCN